jgi:hypothetical protein
LIWNKDISLKRSFWLSVASLVGVLLIGNSLLALSFVLNLGWFIFLLIAALAITCQFFSLIAVLRGASHYPGSKTWPVFARIVAGLFLVIVAVGIPRAGYIFWQHTLDSSRNSANASQTLRRAPAYPLTGFWKGNCSNNGGLLIEPTKEVGIYSISPCGVRGCYRPGTFHPNSSISNDPKYRIIDNNTIVLIEYGGESATRYIRCN